MFEPQHNLTPLHVCMRANVFGLLVRRAWGAAEEEWGSERSTTRRIVSSFWASVHKKPKSKARIRVVTSGNREEGQKHRTPDEGPNPFRTTAVYIRRRRGRGPSDAKRCAVWLGC